MRVSRQLDEAVVCTITIPASFARPNCDGCKLDDAVSFRAESGGFGVHKYEAIVFLQEIFQRSYCVFLLKERGLCMQRCNTELALLVVTDFQNGYERSRSKPNTHSDGSRCSGPSASTH